MLYHKLQYQAVQKVVSHKRQPRCAVQESSAHGLSGRADQKFRVWSKKQWQAALLIRHL